MRAAVLAFIRDQSGGVAIEYGLVAGLVSVGVVLAATTLGTDISEMFGRIQAQVSKVLAS